MWSVVTVQQVEVHPLVTRARALSLATFLIYLSLTLSLLFTSEDLLLLREGQARAQACDMSWGFNAYCLTEDPGIVRWISLMAFTLILAGVRLWAILIPSTYLAWSFANYNLMLEGGDQIASNLAILLLPFLLTIGGGGAGTRAPRRVTGVVIPVTIWLIRLQAVVVYAQAAIDKIRRPEWYDGTAMYYWARDASLQQGEPGWSLLQHLTQLQIFTNVLTWGTVLLELVLAAAILMPRRTRAVLFVVALTFHAGIAAYYGLVTFGLAMTGLLVGALLFDVDLDTFRAKVWAWWPSRRTKEDDSSRAELDRPSSHDYVNDRKVHVHE